VACVYIFRNGNEDLFKIGWSSGDAADRRDDLATGNPHLTLVHSIDSLDDEDAHACEGFLHGSLQSKRYSGEFFALAQAELAEVLENARQYLAERPREREAKRLAGEASDGRILKPTDQQWETYRALLLARENEYRAKSHAYRLKNELKLFIGTADELDGIASWKSHEVARFDAALFKAGNPDLYEKFVRAMPQRKFLLRWKAARV
jgi:hypothetical protein